VYVSPPFNAVFGPMKRGVSDRDESFAPRAEKNLKKLIDGLKNSDRVHGPLRNGCESCSQVSLRCSLNFRSIRTGEEQIVVCV
jgi:hypothetical protein